MKKCPTCDKEFEDSMRFCQVDGTPLVDDAPPFDPYATMVAGPGMPAVAAEGVPTEEISADAAFSPPEEAALVEEAAPVEEVYQTVGSMPIEEPEDVLDLPEADPLKTMYVSDAEMQGALTADKPADGLDVVEIPSIEGSPAPEPPTFSVPDLPAPSFGEMTPPPSPFSASGSNENEPVPAPSAFDEPAPAPTAFDEAETIIQPGFNTPFEQPPPAPIDEWTPPPAPDASWQNQEIGSNTPFQPPPPGAAGANKTLPIISLILGILSLCCYVSPVTGLAAVITGFLGMKNVNNMPDVYGGKGLAIAGMVTGGLLFLFGIIYWIFILFFGGMAMLMDATR